jgi:glycosyl transferase family 1
MKKRKNLKILISDMAARGRYVSRELFQSMEELVRVHGWRHVEAWELAHTRDLASELRRRFRRSPQVLLFWETYHLMDVHQPSIDRMDCHKVFYAEDLHHGDGRDRHRAMSICDTILAAYAPVFSEHYPRIAAEWPVVWIPHSAGPDFFLPFNEDPEPLVFLSGAVSWHYPLRIQVKELADRGAAPIVYHPHPGYHCGYDYEHDERVGKGYAEKIHRHLAAFTDALVYRYTVAKFFEIPATGALLLGDRAVSDALRSLGFEEDIHYLPVGSEDVEEKIAWALDPVHRPRVDEIRRRGQALVLERHTTSHRARQIDEVCGPRG